MAKLHPLAAFLIVTIVLALGLAGFVGIHLLTTGPQQEIGPQEIGPHEIGVGEAALLYLFMAFLAWGVVCAAAVTLGLPMLFVLRRMGLSRNLPALAIGGAVAGAAVLVALASATGGAFIVPMETGWLGITAGFGLLAGVLWWLLTGGRTDVSQGA